MLAGLAAVSTAQTHSNAIPGATYKFTAQGGLSMTFSVSADGSTVDFYNITAVGHEANGGTCDFHAEGDRGIWAGAPIVNNTFKYNLGDNIVFEGRFTGGQSAAGTFTLYDPPLGSAQACHSGTMNWTATTTAKPPHSTGNGGGSSTGNGGGSDPKRTYRTGVSLHRASLRKLAGRITATVGVCRVDRKVTLWIGHRRIATTLSRSSGSFSFRRTMRMRGKSVRASASNANLPALICGAGSSRFIRG
jgi:hypothetical protein